MRQKDPQAMLPGWLRRRRGLVWPGARRQL